MAKCNICGTHTWFFQTHRCKAKPKQEIGRQTVAARSRSERRLTSIDTTDLYLLQQQQNIINSIVIDNEQCRVGHHVHHPIQSNDATPSYSHSSSSECSSSSSWDSGSDSSSSSYSD